ncbi:translocation/assembly module TamB domain-containing protein [Aequorivita marisscotiae]|uniref:Translocation/assembly module TamB n=1 Tax=Aequorivita marisscotiae TaxID=3040348 RepID=A0ABY8KSB2_9FLAO|nr:translocation/assembly module TamB [Aequorivita sp. Ant34-E75]WGF91922.1 translocation/assembly module TamB [Aequorivita sp. Ant34-E75]
MEKKKEKKSKPKYYRFLRFLGKFIVGLIILFFLLVLFIRSPWGQNIIVQRAVKYVSDKTNTSVEIEKLFVTFSGNIVLNGLYLEDKKGDTLIYSKSLEADVPLLPIIRGNTIAINYINWEGLRANIVRKDSINGYNFQFLLDAFAVADTTTVTPDSTSAPLDIVLGDLLLKDFNIVYNDAVLGIDSKFIVGSLALNMKKTDLSKMDFRASEAKIANANITYIQSPVPPSTTEAPPLPYLALNKLLLNNVRVDYQSFGDRIAANLEFSDLFLELPKADLTTNDIEIGDFSLKNSIVTIYTKTENNGITQKVDEVTTDIKEDIEKFEWPDFTISLSEINLEGNNISYFVGKNKGAPNVFNPNAIALENVSLKANSIYLKDKRAGINLDALSFREASGFNLHKLALNLEATDSYLNVNALNLALNNNKLNGKLRLDFNTLASLFEAPEQSKIALDFPVFQVDLKEVFKFQPELKGNEYLKTLSQKLLFGQVKASGYISAIQIPTVNLRWGNTTRIAANAFIENATVPENLKFNIPQFSAQTRRSDLIQFVSEQELGIKLPEDVALKGNAKGNTKDIYANAILTTSQGMAKIDGHFTNDSQIAFNADIEITEYQLNELLQNEQLGPISLQLNTTGSGNDINSLDATLEANVSKFQFNDYAIKNLGIIGNIKNGKGEVISNYKDQNLNVNLNADVVLDSVTPRASAHLNIIGANLQSLGIMTRDVRTAFKLDADFEGNTDGFDVISTVGDGVVVYDNRTYLLGDLLATAHVRSDTTSIWLDNKMIDLSLESNTDPATFSRSVQRHISSYFFKKTAFADTIQNPVKLDVKGKIVEAPVLNEVFLVNVKDLDTVKIDVAFDEAARKLKAAINAPHINYGGNELDSLAFTMDTDKEKFVFNLGFGSIKGGPLEIPKTQISGNQLDGQMNLNFHAVHKDSTLINIQSQITGTSDKLRFHVVPQDLILDRKPWKTPANNEVLIFKNNVEFNDFRFTKNNETVALTHNLSGVLQQHAAITFENFKLSEILNYLNPSEELAKGNLNGSLAIVEPFGNAGLFADLLIDELNLLNVDLGKLTVDAKSKGGNSYDFNLAVKEGEVKLDLTGDYIATETDAKLNLDLNIIDFKMSALEGFTLGEVKNADGSFSGKFNFTGSTTAPKYEGSLNFDNADFTISKLNAPFTLVNESLRIDNNGVYLEGFTILDENQNKLNITGKIGPESYINPTFNLNLNAQNFQVLNATEDDNDMVYGQASFNADAKLTGDLQIPKLDAQITVNKDTNVTYILPSSSVAIEERDGVVLFVNRENPDAILTKNVEKTATFTGLDINAFLNIGKSAKVTIIIDQETGDNFEVFGDGEFNFNMNPNGRMTLSGVYEIAGGHYEMNLYNLVNRRFELSPKSRVTWSGDPFDAKLDVKAIYTVKASASPLMAPITSGSDPSVKNKYKQVLPFNVYLNIDGQLTQPEIGFDLDMPEEEQGAIGGQVYGRLQQVNTQQDELNRQVFSLLVLGRFYPEPGSDGSRGGFATVARDNLNDAISDQLNVFSNKLLGNTGVELDFGLDSYTDYQGETAQERTQLDIAAQKKLFNDRLIVRVGSEVDIQGSSATNEPVPIIGDVSLEYLLTENGRYRLKGFRKNQFENIVDGQTIVSGIALIFTQEFNKFDELWQALLRGETKEEKAEKKAAAQQPKKEQEQAEKNKTDKIENTNNE